MKLPLSRLCLPLLGSLLLAGSVCGQTPPTLENDVRNVFQRQPSSPVWPPTSTSPAGLIPTINQFKGGTVVGGWQTTRITSKGAVVVSTGLPSASYAVFSATVSSGFSLGSAFDGNEATALRVALAAGSQTSGAVLRVDLGQNRVISGFSLVTNNSDAYRDPSRFNISGGNSPDITTHVSLGGDSFPASMARKASSSIYPIVNAGSYRYISISLWPKAGSTLLEVSELRLWTAGTAVVLAGSPTTTVGNTTLTLPAGIPLTSAGTPSTTLGVKLEFARIGTPLVARAVSNLLGGAIAPPVFDVNGAPLALNVRDNWYLPEPDNSSTGRFYYSPHAKMVFATQPGVVEVTWRERTPVNGVNRTITRSYVIAASPVKPVRKVYWTENGFKGPLIQVPTSRVASVNIVYNSLFPATVAAADVYVQPGAVVDPNPNLYAERRTLWYSALDNSLHAFNREGRVFVELLGAPRADGLSREFLGYEIVEVTQEIAPTTERVDIGDELSPLNGEDLVHRVIAGTADVDGFGPFLHQHYTQGNALSRLFAIRKTTELRSSATGVELPSNEVLMYWMEKGDLGLLWPKYYSGYILDWPDDDARYSIYARSTDAAAATAVRLNSADNPALVYQDVAHASLNSSFEFQSTVTAAMAANRVGDILDPQGRSLIRYTNGDAIWFERVRSRLDTEFSGYTGVPITVNVGARILPPSGSDSLVGYIRQASGTAFNVNAYKDPFVVGFEEAAKGAIIGVNALTNNRILEVWWYKRNQPAVAGIKAGYWPSLVQKYQLSWPVVIDPIVANPSFETPVLSTGAFQLRPAGTSWTLEGNCYITRLGAGSPWSLVATPSGAQCAIVQSTGAMSQGITLSGGTYRIGFKALGRMNYNINQIAVSFNGVQVGDFDPNLISRTLWGQFYSANFSVTRTGTYTLKFAGLLQNGQFDYSTLIDDIVIERVPGAEDNSPREIVLASNAGSGDLSSLQASGSIYTQNDSTLPGYNPNEEHALMLNGRAWALRDDLNQPTSSDPWVLLEYTDADERPSMIVFKLLREKPAVGWTFLYTVEAGKVLQAPMPLPILPLPLRTDYATGWTWKGYFLNGAWFPTTKNQELVANHEVAVTPEAPANAALATTQANSDAPRYGEFTFLDRKGVTWVYRGMRSGAATARFGMRYFYPTQPGFYFPSLTAAAQPALGTIVPYLRARATENPVSGEALTINFVPVWPASTPELRIGETLTRAKYNLPDVRSQTSAEIIYQQSIANDPAAALTSATLFDPTRNKTYPLSSTTLTAIPASAATDVYLGKTYFTRLPPHLSTRFYFDPNMGAKGTLVLKGAFKQEALGEDYLLLNVLSTEDVTALKGLVDSTDERKTAWDTAITGLSTTLETFKQDPAKRGTYIVDTTQNRAVAGTALASITNDDTAIDSYAISASGGGQGYVVMAVGNGRAFTPEDEPVSLHVFKVVPPIYRGELKIVQSTNPLDEKLTLRHSSDFAGAPSGYEFEWRYAPPVDGVPPTLYTFSRVDVAVGATPPPSPAIAGWRVYNQPTADFTTLRLPYSATSATLVASGAPANLPANVAIKDTRDTIEHGTTRPQAILRNEFNYTPALPWRTFVSLQLGNRDGADVYLNGALVAVINRPGDNNTATVSKPRADFNPLPLLYEVPSTLLRTTGNVVAVELYTDADLNVSSSINVRIEGILESPTTAGWTLITPVGSEVGGAMTGSIVGKTQHVIQGTSLLTLTDNYFTMRYRARSAPNAAFVANGGWSKWTDPQLAEGWIKRALAGINPFQQRITNLFSNQVDTSVSLVQQAGRRWEGDIALNLSNINRFGLIEIYETILRRGKSLSIEGAPAINYGAANDALLLAAGYLSDLYMIHGNEAFADAANPTIAYGLDNGAAYGDVATSLFAFKGQLATVLDEELTLLRGRDNSLQPGTRVNPVYNRLVWNYTRGIDSGEAIYALNYNIKDMDGDGLVGAADAAILYPQGHGDSYGHYLTALTGYYGLLANSNFSWTPRTEAVTILGKPVQVDYFDERKFAKAAVAATRTAAQIIDLTYRQAFTTGSATSWAALKDGRTINGVMRRWGVDEWASRGGQGSYFHWLTGNSLLPALDNDSTHEGIQKIDRTTVPELAELVSQASAIQQSLSNADARLNPLGLVSGALAFDITPSEVDAGNTHFEQIYSRATKALQNAVTAFQNAKSSTQFLRQQEDSLTQLRVAVTQQEQAYTNQLIALYGTPYTDDIGAGKTYVQDYAGPDLLHYQYVDIPEGLITGNVTEFPMLIQPEFNAANPGVINFNEGQTVTYVLDSTGNYRKPASWVGRRQSPGQIQTAVSDVLLARLQLYAVANDYSGAKEDLENLVKVFKASVDAHNNLIQNMEKYQASFTAIETIQQALGTSKLVFEQLAEFTQEFLEAAASAPPTVVGLANDATSAIRASFKFTKAATVAAMRSSMIVAELSERVLEQTKLSLERLKEIEQTNIAWAQEYAQLVHDLRESLNDIVDKQPGVDVAMRRYDQAQRNLLATVAAGERLQLERQTFRLNSAAIIQGYRTKDLGFRAFRDEALEKYKQLYDLSARYAYLAATAYDYETGLIDVAGNSSAASFVDKIVKARSPGVLAGGVPQFGGATSGDPGLAGALAQLNSDWAVVKSRLGFNNPDRYRTTFSLRAENYRIVSGSSGDAGWREILLAARRDNLMDDPDAARHCLNLGLTPGMAVPGFILEFSTTISPGFNFFGKPLAGGDSSFSATSFATKIRASGVAFTGYVGMASPTTTSNVVTAVGGTSPTDPYTAYNDSSALSATPYLYLVPTGTDSMRAPYGNGAIVRTFSVVDQAVPLPFNVGNSNFASARNWTAMSSVSEGFVVRQHQAFRAVPDGTLNSSQPGVYLSQPGFTNARLIGRSVWNSRWKLIIPGQTLMSDPRRGMQVFVDSVKDIKVHFETYSNAGN